MDYTDVYGNAKSINFFFEFAFLANMSFKLKKVDPSFAFNSVRIQKASNNAFISSLKLSLYKKEDLTEKGLNSATHNRPLMSVGCIIDTPSEVPAVLSDIHSQYLSLMSL